jgi:Outer membrane protein (OmpH-like).
MPGIQKVDTLLNDYVTDSLRPEYDYKLAELKRKDSTFKKDSASMNASLREIMKKEITQATYEIVNWQQYQQQKYQAKQQELLNPYLAKIEKVFEDVVKEQKYTHVVAPNVLRWVADDKSTADIPLRVLAKLNIPLPQEIQDQIKALGITSGGGAAKSTTPAKH